MKTYKVKITEKLQMTVEVGAPSRHEAERFAEKQWLNGDYILDVEAAGSNPVTSTIRESA